MANLSQIPFKTTWTNLRRHPASVEDQRLFLSGSTCLEKDNYCASGENCDHNLEFKTFLSIPSKESKREKKKTVVVTVKAIYLFYPSEEGQFHSMNRSLCFPAKVNTLPPSLAILPLLIIHCVYYGRFFLKKGVWQPFSMCWSQFFLYDLLKVIKGGSKQSESGEALVACGLNNKK